MTAPGRTPAPGPDDRGSVLLLGVGLVAVALLALAVLTDAAAALLQRQRLLAVADGAALAGAQAIDLVTYYEFGAGSQTRLDSTSVDVAARRHLAGTGARLDIDGLQVERVWSDGQQVLVELSAPLTLPFLADLFGGEVRVQSWSQLSYRDPDESAAAP